jgi:hypothetical protein
MNQSDIISVNFKSLAAALTKQLVQLGRIEAEGSSIQDNSFSTPRTPWFPSDDESGIALT